MVGQLNRSPAATFDLERIDPRSSGYSAQWELAPHGPAEKGTSVRLQCLAPRVTVAHMDQPAGYLHWGFILISWPNLILIGLMVALFALALVLPFPGHSAPVEEKKKS